MNNNYLKQTTIEPGILIIELNRPESMNALNSEAVAELSNLLNDIESRNDIKVVIITGKNHFAAGADIAEMVNLDRNGAFAFAFGKVFNRLEKLRMPTIAAIDGYALGGGLELALCCDIRIASKDAILGLPEITLGIFPGAGGTVRLPKLIGEGRAKEMIFFGKPINASKAEQIGLVNFVVDGSQLEEYVLKMASKLAKSATLALKNAKQSISGNTNVHDDPFARECDLWCDLFKTEDQKEGMSAFLEKRKPTYKGK